MFNKNIRVDILFILAIFAFSLMMGWPLLRFDQVSSGHDMQLNFFKVVAVRQAFLDGYFSLRWLPDPLHGYGSPMMNFHQPLIYYITAFLAYIFPLVFSFNLVTFLFLFGSGVAMYLLAREFWGKEGGLIAATAYLFAPYHIMDIYVRAALTEAAAFFFVPIIAWSLLRLSRRFSSLDFVIGVIAVAGLGMTHLISFVLFIPAALAYSVMTQIVAWRVTASGQVVLRNLRTRIIGMLTGFLVMGMGMLLSAWFWIPAIMEKKHIQIELAFSGFFHYAQHFLYWPQILYSRWGFGGSVGGANDDTSFMVGILQLMLAGVVLIHWKKISSLVLDAGSHIFFFAACCLLALFLTTGGSAFIWDVIPSLRMIQFPWRFLLPATFALCFLSGGILYCMPDQWKKKGLVLIVTGLVLSGIFFCHPQRYFPVAGLASRDFLINSDFNGVSSEFLPLHAPGTVLPLPQEKMLIVQGTAKVIDDGGRPLDRKFRIHATTLSAVCFCAYYFPGWEVFVDGKQVDIVADNPYGLIMFLVPEGAHYVRVRFGTTPLRIMANVLSIIALAGIVGIFLFRRRIDSELLLHF